MYEPTLSVISDTLGPRVELVFTNVPVTATTATIYRTSGKQRMLVRGAVRTGIGGSFSRVDYEVPFDVASSYVATFYNPAGGEIGTSGAVVITVPSEHPSFVRIHNPLDPRTSVLVQLEEEALRKTGRSFGGTVHQPLGRQGGIVASTGRRGYEGLNLPVITMSVEESERFDALFENQLPILCFRLPGSHRNFRMPPVLFASTLDPESEQWIDVQQAVWHLKGDQVTPPAPGIILSLLRRKDVAAYYATRREKKAANASRLQVSRRYELAGIAE